MGKQWLTLFCWAPKSMQIVIAAMKLKNCLLLGRKAMTNLDSILKSRDITLPTKVCPVKAMVFPVVMYGCESWTIKKADHWRIDAFELWCWRRLLRVPWTARRSTQSILKENSPEYSLEGLTLKLKLQIFGHMTWRTDSFESFLWQIVFFKDLLPYWSRSQLTRCFFLNIKLVPAHQKVYIPSFWT